RRNARYFVSGRVRKGRQSARTHAAAVNSAQSCRALEDRHAGRRVRFVALEIAAISIVASVSLSAQEAPPSLRAGPLTARVTSDGRLDEAAWSSAPSIDMFVQTEPVEGAPPTGRTIVRVLADRRTVVIGVVCEYPDDVGVVSFSVRRDAPLSSEDHVRVVLGPFADGRSGYA